MSIDVGRVVHAVCLYGFRVDSVCLDEGWCVEAVCFWF